MAQRPPGPYRPNPSRTERQMMGKDPLDADPDELTAYRERAKLENRTWFLRASLALNIAIIAGLTIHYLTSCQ